MRCVKQAGTTMTNRFLSILGMAQRAGKLVGGEDRVLQAIQKGKARLVILARDASHNTAKKFTDKCTYYKIQLCREYDRTTLGQATGRTERVVIAVTDKGFADALMSSVKTDVNLNHSEVKDIEQTTRQER